MSPFDNSKHLITSGLQTSHEVGSAQRISELRDQLANAIEQRESLIPSLSGHAFRVGLAQTLQDLAFDDLVLLERLSGVALIDRLVAMQATHGGDFNVEQANLLGAFTEVAISQEDCWGIEGTSGSDLSLSALVDGGAQHE
jgi:hypothetical protein